MTTCIKVPLKEAEKAKRELMDKQWIDSEHRPLKKEDYIYFPVLENYAGSWPKDEQELQQNESPKSAISYKDALAKVLSNEEMENVKTAYDVLGTVSVIEIGDGLESKEKLIAETLLESNPLIKTVLRKDGSHDGVFRTQNMKFLAGEETKIAEYRENNCIMRVNVEDVYFSARLSTERKRISDMVKEGEHILVMFSGAAPYPCVLAKNTLAKHIVGVEINPEGHKYGLENITRNKITNVDLYCGDVRDVLPTLDEKFDRIIMPLPKTAEEFLDVTLPRANKNCVIHLYGFYHEDDFDKARQEIEKYCKEAGRTYDNLEIIKSGQQKPHVYRICADFEVTN